MDPLLEKLKSFDWPLPDQDEAGYQQIKAKVAKAGKRRQLLTYSDLVRGVDFHDPDRNSGKPFQLNIAGWTGLDRHIIGQYLGKLSCETYENHGFMANALVVDAINGMPSKIFFQWMEYIEAIPDKNDHEMERFWANQLRKAQAWYRSNT